jgi:hypothetical protein
MRRVARRGDAKKSVRRDAENARRPGKRNEGEEGEDGASASSAVTFFSDTMAPGNFERR